MRTTVDLPDELLRHAKVRAALEGVRLKDLLARYVAQGLNRGDGGSAPIPRRRSPLPTIRKAHAGRPVAARTNSEIQAILDAEDAERTNRSARR